ncbi:asparagine synthase-related protein [Ectothiorhodospira variabilis]|uniref:asparagine synthase-related protein n=1 Tax=Ectothiorhodospira variabilis TaxID=505694 RepID=UPI001EFA9C30|nr:asparagine synthase-related protein [Ectothiorhodospira variabilis]MCG5495337.1 asparagine synthetase B family protein [Ectothiorhodospira variabilis]MCG5504935.1 asparagine synthetase B family protein [Ectothiorhodospira variabilis]MCG5508092.1 asparagine synthetase B family protein [Ectothiorhodospira variabilis]
MKFHPFETLASRTRPFFAARKTNAGVKIDGLPTCNLGHVIAGGGRPVPDGLFVNWHWDGDRLIVTNDRYGIYPLFYSHYGSEIRISPSIYHILDGDFPKTLNFPGLAVFLRLDFFIGEDTPFEHIHVLPPGSRLTWTQGELTLERGSREVPAGVPLSFDDSVDRYIELFAQSIRRRPPLEAFHLPLSGGRDSRHILFELIKQGHRPDRVVTVQPHPPVDDEDRRIAALLAQELALDHDEVSYSPSYLAATLKDIELTEMCASAHTWLMPLAGYLEARASRYIYDGLAGSVLSGGFQVTDEKHSLLSNGKTSSLARMLLGGTDKERTLQAQLRSSFIKCIPKEIAVERLSHELDSHTKQRNPLVSYIFWNRTRRLVSLIPVSMLSHVQTVFCPYLDHDLFDFLINLNPNDTLGNRLHDEAIKRAYPQYAHIPYESKTNRPADPKEHRRYYNRSARETLGHLVRHPALATSGMIKTERLAATLVRDSLSRRPPKAWYLHTLLHLFELERLAKTVQG